MIRLARLTARDVPHPGPGKARFEVRPRRTDGSEVWKVPAVGSVGSPVMVEFRANEQAALRAVIRFQKRENA